MNESKHKTSVWQMLIAMAEKLTNTSWDQTMEFQMVTKMK